MCGDYVVLIDVLRAVVVRIEFTGFV